MKKNLLKAVVVVVGVMIVDIVINVICNINGVDLNSISNTFVAVMLCFFIMYGSRITKVSSGQGYSS